MKAECSFFLGSNTPNGFCSFFDELFFPNGEGTTYILKGGPGCGKSSLMKKIADTADEKGIFCERIYCSSDEQSLDAVIIPQLRVNIADGTPPHTLEPRLPGVSEILINPGEAWSREKLKKNRAEIAELSGSIAAEHAKSTRFLAAAGGLLDDSCKIELENTDKSKLFNFARRIAAREFTAKKGEKRGKISRRFLSAPTPAGLCVHYGSIDKLCSRVIEINGIMGCAAGILTEYLAELAVLRGYDIYLCYCPLSCGKKAEHLLIPELSLCFFTSQLWHPAPADCEKTINLSRFTNTMEMKKHRERLEFNETAAAELITEAMRHTEKAKRLHDTLEAYYTAAMDFSKINTLRESLISEIFS